jgi:hypothetical protein
MKKGYQISFIAHFLQDNSNYKMRMTGKGIPHKGRRIFHHDLRTG